MKREQLITYKLGFSVKKTRPPLKGRWIDNVFIERLWWSVKYEEVYSKAYGSITEARAELKKYFQFYNGRRRHKNLGRKTPDSVYRVALPAQEAA